MDTLTLKFKNKNSLGAWGGPLKLKFANNFIIYKKCPFRGRIVPGGLHSELCAWGVKFLRNRVGLYGFAWRTFFGTILPDDYANHYSSTSFRNGRSWVQFIAWAQAHSVYYSLFCVSNLLHIQESLFYDIRKKTQNWPITRMHNNYVNRNYETYHIKWRILILELSNSRGFKKQVVSTRKMIAIKFILFFVICSLSAAMILQQIQGRIQYKSKSVSNKEKILAYLRLGQLNRSRSGLLFH